MELLKHSFMSTISLNVTNKTILNLELEVSSEIGNNFCYFIVCLTHAF